MLHAKQRMKERFGIPLTSSVATEIKRQILDGVAEFVGKQTNSRYVYQVNLGEQQIIVIFDYPKRFIVTVLKPGMRYWLK